MNRRSLQVLIGAALFSALGLQAPVFADWLSKGRLPLRVFTDRDGLPQNAITSIVFAKDGALWVGTKDGAARYNGRVWTAVRMPKGCPSNWINEVLPSEDGSVWFATRAGGLARLKDGAWTVYSQDSGLPGAEVPALLEASVFGGAPVVLAGTSGGVARFDGTKFVPLAFPAGVRSTWVTSLFEVKEAGGVPSLWIGTRGGILRYRSNVWTTFDLSEFDASANNPVRSFALTTAFDGQPTLIAGLTHNVLHFDGSRWVKKPLPGPWIGALQTLLATREDDGSETLWVGGQRLLIRVRKDQAESFDASSGFPGDGFWSLAETPQGRGERALWIGMSGGGLVRLQRDGWTTFDPPRWLSDSSVYGLLETIEPDGSQTIWVGTNRGGLVRMQGDERTVFSGSSKPGSDTVLSLAETRSPSVGRAVWVGTTFGLGVLRNGRWSKYFFPKGMPEAFINALLPSPRENGEPALWVGTGDGLGLIEGGGMRNMSGVLGQADPHVNTLLETTEADGVRVLWVGTHRGLVRYAQGKATSITMKEGLPADEVLSLVAVREGSRRRLWVGTRGGAARLDLDEPGWNIATFSMDSIPALPNNTIYQVRQDLLGRLYLFTNQGIARLTPRTPTRDAPSPYEMYVFTTEDGLPSNECNTGSSMVDSKGQIWVGTIKGAAVLKPEPEGEAQAKPLRIEQAVISRTGSPLTAGAALAHNQGNLTFEYALMGFFRDADTLYRTQLVGLDREPSAWAHDAKKEYTSLPEGRYAFNVWGRDVNGVVTGPATLAFSVRAAPWRTWWAYLGYALVLAGLISASVRWRLSAVRRHNEDLERLISARTGELGEAVQRLSVSEQQALQAKDTALEASRAKSIFLANMSHELRTPLNAVIGFAQVLERRDSFRGEDRESLRIIQRSGEHLLGLINDVLSLSKIEAGALTLLEKPFDLRALLEGVRAITCGRAETKDLEVVFDLEPGLPVGVRGDEGRLRQVLINLLSNAVKFTSVGRVTLRAGYRDGRARFAVEDTGQGIAEGELPKLFSAFVQTESGESSREGTGLGLAISAQIVKQMGGEIRVRSRVGAGSVFGFEISLPRTEGVLANDERRVVGLAPGHPKVRVLIVDDTAENRLLLKQVLGSSGFEVQEAKDGQQAVESFLTFHPALILMDARMKGMDGREATRRIREHEARGAGRPRTVIIALTAGVFEHEREQMLQAGADDFVAKPFRIETIFEKLGVFLGVTYAYEDASKAKADGGSEATDLTKERLSALSAEQRRDLYEALAAGHVRKAEAAAERIRADDEPLGSTLLAEIRAFKLDDLLSLLEQLEPAQAR